MLNKGFSQSGLYRFNEPITYTLSSNSELHRTSFLYAGSSSSEEDMSGEHTTSHEAVVNECTNCVSGSNSAPRQISFLYASSSSSEDDTDDEDTITPDAYVTDYNEPFPGQNTCLPFELWPDTPLPFEVWQPEHASTSLTTPTSSQDMPWSYNNPPFSPVLFPTNEPPPLHLSIYPLQTQRGYRATVVPYQSIWPSQFETISAHLHHVFTTSTPPAPYKIIEHVGSTSIPGIAAKPNIDVLVTFACRSDLEKGMEALDWEITKLERYTRVPNGGGIQGRESYKLYISDNSVRYYDTPVRSVYLIEESENNPAGLVQIRCYRSVRDTLRDRRNVDLLQEYSAFKVELAKRIFDDAITYSALKNGIIRKVLRRAGWREDEIDEKDRLSERTLWKPEEPPY